MKTQSIRELATAEAAKAKGPYVVPSEAFRKALHHELCQTVKLRPANPEIESPFGARFVGEKSTRITAVKGRFADRLTDFFAEELEVQIAMNPGVTQLDVACHNTIDNGVNLWGDTAFVGFRLR